MKFGLTSTKKISCPICSVAFSTKALMCAHIRLEMILESETDTGAPKPHPVAKGCVREFKLCPKCTYPFPSNGALRHAQACSGAPPSKALLQTQLSLTPKTPSRRQAIANLEKAVNSALPSTPPPPPPPAPPALRCPYGKPVVIPAH